MFRRVVDVVLLSAAFSAAWLIAGTLTAASRHQDVSLRELKQSRGANPSQQEDGVNYTCDVYMADNANALPAEGCDANPGNEDSACVYCLDDYTDWVITFDFKDPGVLTSLATCGNLYAGSCQPANGVLACNAQMVMTLCPEPTEQIAQDY